MWMGNKIGYPLKDSGNVSLNLKRATFPLTCSLKLWKCEPSVGIMALAKNNFGQDDRIENWPPH